MLINMQTMKKNIYILLILNLFIIFIVDNCFAQKETYNWYFGNNAGISFLTDDLEPVFLSGSKMEQMEGVSTISDKNGNLLFYSDGVYVWNRQHSYISYGGGLKGNYSSSRSVIIIPRPRSNRYYYVFTIDAFERSLGISSDTNGLRYSVIDVLGDKYGAIIPDKYNIKLLDGAVEKMITINHANKIDVWLVTYNRKNNSFYTYLINRNGINTPKITKLNELDSISLLDAVFNLEYDFEHKKLINCSRASYSFEVYDFDNLTGEIDVANSLKIPSFIPHPNSGEDSTQFFIPYSAAISADGTKLYASCYRKSILQYDISSKNIEEICKTRCVIADSLNGDGSFGSIRKGPNGKIYITCDTSEYLSVINFPNKLGKECNFVKKAIFLEGGCCRLGLPIMMNYDVPPCDFSGYAGDDKIVCTGEELKIGDVADTTNLKFEWTPQMFLDNPYILNPVCRPLETITYVLKITDTELDCFDFDTVTITVIEAPKILNAEDVHTCKNNSIMIGNSNNSDEYIYQWEPELYLDDFNAKTPICKPETEMTYILTVTNEFGCKSYDTVRVFLKPLSDINITGDSYICEGDSTTLRLKGDFISCEWNTGETTNSIVVKKTGVYSAEVVDRNGCTGDIYFEVKYFVSDSIKIIAPKTICENTYTNIYVEDVFESYLWSTGETTSSIDVNKSGKYWVIGVNENGCKSYDTVDILSYELNYTLYDEAINLYSCLYNSTSQEFYIQNEGEEAITVSSIKLLINDTKNNIDIVTTNTLPENIEDRFYFNINLVGLEVGNYYDTVLVEVSYPCQMLIKIPINIIINEEYLSVSSKDIIIRPGQNIIIPIYTLYHNVNSYLPDTAIFLYDFFYDNELLKIKSVKNANIIFDDYNSGILHLSKNTLQIKQGDTIFIEAFTSLGTSEEFNLKDVFSFRVFLKPPVDVDTKYYCIDTCSSIHSINIDGCMVSLEKFKLLNNTVLKINNVIDNTIKCNISTQEIGELNVELCGLAGNIIDKKVWMRKEDNFESKEIIFNIENYVNGIYFIILRTNNNYFSEKFIIFK